MSDAAAPSHSPARVPLAEQIAEVEREIRQRCRVYPKWVADGRYKPETADAKLAALRAAQSTLVWLEQNEHWIRPQAQRRAADARLAAEAEALRGHPAVTAVFDAFPDAAIADVRALTTAHADTDSQLEPEDIDA
jgi:hypothetical protein